jgi:hypothetical protein
VVCFLSSGLWAQKRKEINFPYNAEGKIEYVFQQVLPKKKQKTLFKNTADWLRQDTSLKIVRSDAKTGVMNITGHFLVPTPRVQHPVDYKIDIYIKKDTVRYLVHDFYLPEINHSLEAILEKHKGTGKELVQESLWYLTAGLHGKVGTWSNAFKAYLGGKKD